MKRFFTGILLGCLLLLLCSCQLNLPRETSQAGVDLTQLEKPVFSTGEEIPSPTPEREKTSLRIDLWLSGTPLMGGLPTTATDITSARYRYQTGGFHYRFEETTGLYEELLTCMLSASEEAQGFLRLLRFGHERLPEDFLLSQGLGGDSESLRRDMLTVAYDPLPSLFKGFSPQDSATDSFYHVGSSWGNRLGELEEKYLENPGEKEKMQTALNLQQESLAAGETTFSALGEDEDSPLLYALENLDLTRLSVILFDPGEVRSLTGVDSQGTLHSLVEEIFRERGIFEEGLTVGLYAFRLDYLGKLSSFGRADFATPLVWGKLRFVKDKNRAEDAQPMPRILLCLMIGEEEDLSAFTKQLEEQLSASEILKETRGLEKYPLTYAWQGETVTQEPFSFEYHSLTLSRPQLETLTETTPGATAALTGAEPAREETGLYTLTAGEESTLTLTLPLTLGEEGITADLTRLSGIEITCQGSLTLDSVLENHPGVEIPEGSQTLSYRDKIYVFTQKGAGESTLTLREVRKTEEGLELTLNLPGLEPGYYRFRLSADWTGESLDWDIPSWVEEWNTEITSVQVGQWEEFTRVLAEENQGKVTPPNRFTHAWGEATGKPYNNVTVPDCPPVFLAPGLTELIQQLQAAARPDAVPLIRYEFEVFAQGDPSLS